MGRLRDVGASNPHLRSLRGQPRLHVDAPGLVQVVVASLGGWRVVSKSLEKKSFGKIPLNIRIEVWIGMFRGDLQ